jgi:hypothetical protein
MSVIRPIGPKPWMTAGEYLDAIRLDGRFRHAKRVIALVYIDSEGTWHTVCQDARASELAYAALLLQHDAINTGKVAIDDD